MQDNKSCDFIKYYIVPHKLMAISHYETSLTKYLM